MRWALAILLIGCAPKPAVPPCRAESPCVDRVGGVEAFTVENAKAVTEVPPWPFTWNGRRGVVISSDFASRCYSEKTLDSVSTLAFAEGDCTVLVGGATAAEPDAGVLGEATDFRRNYEGAMSAEVIGPALWAVTHGENKNYREPHAYYPGTVNLDVGPECWSGYDAATDSWRECWEAYNGFVGLARVDTEGVTTDLGPIVWPTGGYVTDAGVKTGEGLRHPSSLTAGGYMYVFYEDESWASEGIKVARARIEALPSFTAYDGTGFNAPALPAGFSNERIRAFYSAPGPAAAPLFDVPEFDSVRFSVAAVRGTAWFLGVEERVSPDAWQLALRSSRDLVHWSVPTVVAALSAPTWAEGQLNYPILVNREGATGEIDASDFSIVGTHVSEPRRVRLSVRMPEVAP